MLADRGGAQRAQEFVEGGQAFAGGGEGAFGGRRKARGEAGKAVALDAGVTGEEARFQGRGDTRESLFVDGDIAGERIADCLSQAELTIEKRLTY